jgi:four helix bundle protein
MAKRIEDLPIHSKVDEFWNAINAILDLPAVRRDSDLHGQIARANESFGSNMVEGFEQGTDRAFAHYLTYSKGEVSSNTSRSRIGRIGAITAQPSKRDVERIGLERPDSRIRRSVIGRLAN